LPLPATGRGYLVRARGRDVEAVRAITASADDVHLVAGHDHPNRNLAQRRREAGDLVDALATDVQRREERAELSGRGLPGHDRGHCRTSLVARQRPAGGDYAQRLTRV